MGLYDRVLRDCCVLFVLRVSRASCVILILLVTIVVLYCFFTVFLLLLLLIILLLVFIVTSGFSVVVFNVFAAVFGFTTAALIFLFGLYCC